MINKKRVKRDVRVVEYVKKVVTVYEVDGKEYTNVSEAKKAVRRKIGDKLEQFIITISNKHNLWHTSHQNMSTFERKCRWQGGEILIKKDVEKQLRQMLSLIKEYNAIQV